MGGIYLWLHDFQFTSLLPFAIAMRMMYAKIARQELAIILLLKELQQRGLIIIQGNDVLICGF
jgi:hypothetical protein